MTAEEYRATLPQKAYWYVAPNFDQFDEAAFHAEILRRLQGSPKSPEYTFLTEQ